MVVVDVQRWGNSQGIRIPKSILKLCGLNVGDSLECVVEHGRLVLKPIRGKREVGFSLEEVLEKIPESFENEEVFWGDVEGGEV